MSQIQNITSYEEKTLQQNNSEETLSSEEIVEELVSQGLPDAYCPATFISKIASQYSISIKEARNCLKEAVKELEAANPNDENDEKQEQLYAQSGYFYPSGYSKNSTSTTKDGMSSLSSLGYYNKLMFGLS